MSNDKEKSSQISGLFITGLLAILGTVIGGVINGLVNANLTEQKFQTDLMIKALESASTDERIESLKFLIETNLVSRKDLSTGIENYLKAHPKSVPQFSSVQQVISEAQNKLLGGDTTRYTDFDIFVCKEKENDPKAGKLITEVISRFANATQVGRIRPKIWSAYDEVSYMELKGKTTIIVDSKRQSNQSLLMSFAPIER
jgi:hypothetical protein